MDGNYIEYMIENGAFDGLLGVRVRAIEAGRITLELPFREDLLGSRERRALHGGALATLINTAGSMAVWSTLDIRTQHVATIDLRLDFLRPGRAEAVIAEASVVRVGRHVGVADVRLHHPCDPTTPVALGRGSFAIRSSGDRRAATD